MNKTVLSQLKSAINRNLDERARRIIESDGSYLSIADFVLLINYMRKIGRFSRPVLEYAYSKSIYRNVLFTDRFHAIYLVMRVCRNGDIDIVRLLLTDPGIDSVDCFYALETACDAGHIRIVSLLLADDRIDSRILKISDMPLNKACLSGHNDIVKLLLACNKFGADYDMYGSIDTACMIGNAEALRLLLADDRSNRINFDDNDLSFITNASIRGHVDVVRILLADQRIRPDVRRNQAINDASYLGNAAMVELLLTDRRVVEAGLDAAITSAQVLDHPAVLSMLTAAEKAKD